MAGKQKTRYRERLTVCGDYMFVDVFPVFPAGEYTTRSGKRKKKFRPTSEVQKKLNDRRSMNAAEEMIFYNFGVNDLEIDLTYNDGWLPDNDEDAIKDVNNFIRRIKRLYKASNVELRYFIVPVGGESRYHSHIFLSGGVNRTKIEQCWRGRGWANCRSLEWNETGIADLANYTHLQDFIGTRRWRCSRNCKRPAPTKERDYTYDRKRVIEVAESPYSAANVIEHLYPGYILSEMPYLCLNDVNGGAYMRMMLYREDAEFMKIRRGIGKYRSEDTERYRLPDESPEERQVRLL